MAATITLDEIRALRQRLTLDAVAQLDLTDEERTRLVTEMRVYTTQLHTGDLTDWHQHVTPAEPGRCEDCDTHVEERYRYGKVDICQAHVTARLRTRRRLEAGHL
jgi:hypothetical protein